MSDEQHIELYKKYRPKKWEDLVGQQKVAKSFQSAIVNNKLPTAYGLFGKYGCGKTSAAFLLAKAVNCLNIQKNGNPCNECDVCVSIDNGSQMGVNYISMANKGSVEDVRTLVQEARVNQPVKRQVWILDEVHNLSKQAFDSLLIPIEDPSMPALFVLCSTEVNKIPLAVRSRIQSRKITPVLPEDMRPYLQRINEQENLDCTDEMLDEAIMHGNGSVRDTLSSLETIIEAGSLSNMLTGNILEAMSEKDLAKALSYVAKSVDDGYEGREIAERLFTDLKNLLLLASGVDKSMMGLIPVQKDLKTVVRGLMGKNGLVAIAEEFADAITHMTLGSDSRIHLEIAVVKAISRITKMQRNYDAKSNS